MEMRCAEFVDGLEALLDGTLPAGERARALAHAADCAACGLIHGLASERHESPAAEVPADLTAAILARTSGPTCGLVRERLAEHAGGRLEGTDDGRLEGTDGPLEDADRELLDAHLRDCPDCTALATVLARLDGDLPALAELEPDAELTATVLARTLSGADRPSFADGSTPRQAHDRPAARVAGRPAERMRRARADRAGAIGRASLRGGVAALQNRLRRAPRAGKAAAPRRAGRRLLARPRIAWEAGCAGALAAWLVCGASWAPLHGVPMEALALVRQGAAGAQAAGDTVTTFNLGVAELSARGVEAARRGAGAATGGVLDALAARYRQVAAAAPDAARHWRQLTEAVRDRDLFGGVAALWSLSLDAGAMLAELLFSPFLQVAPAEVEPAPGRRNTP